LICKEELSLQEGTTKQSILARVYNPDHLLKQKKALKSKFSAIMVKYMIGLE